MLSKVVGAFALLMLFTGENGVIFCARRDTPLAIGYGEGEMFAGSNALARQVNKPVRGFKGKGRRPDHRSAASDRPAHDGGQR